MLRLSLPAACLFLLGLAGVSAQTNTPSTNTPGTNAPAAAAPKTIALGDIVTTAQADTDKLQAYRNGLSSDQTLSAVAEKLPAITRQIDDRVKQDAPLVAGTPSLNILQPSQIAWQSISASLVAEQKSLSDRVQQLDTILMALGQMDDAWKATLAARKDTAPPDILQHIQQVRTLIAETTATVQASLSPLGSMQNRVAEQESRAQTGLAGIDKAIETARSDLFKQNQPPLWNAEAVAPAGGGMVATEKISFQSQLSALKSYLREKIITVLVHLLLLALLVAGFYWLRNSIHARAKDDSSLKTAAQVFDMPLATALLLTLILSWFLYPESPRLLKGISGAAALVPAIIVIRRLIDPANIFLLYAIIVSYLVDQLRFVLTPAGVPARFLFIAEMMGVGIFLLAALRAKSLANTTAGNTRLRHLTRIYLHLAFFVFVVAGFANVFGYVQFSALVGNGMLKSSYLAVILYAAVRIIDALAITAFSVRPLSSLGMVRHHHDLIYKNTSSAIRWLIFGLWLAAALEMVALLSPVWQETIKILDTHVDWFFISFKLGALLAFPITVWASFILSRFIRFVLEEEVYPHLSLGRGIPYAASAMVHYTILLLGFFAAMAATGAPLSQFSFLAGAFGVGLGFGLQNIFNNFVSGIILLFERPIKVGDTIQIDATTIGTVERIGIRASVIQLTNGSELIVPNGNLISNPVTNWTLSNCERLIEIPVNVTTKVDPRHIVELLIKVAQAHPNVIKNPAPQALLTAPGGATQAFRLRVWIDSEEEWMKVTSDLSIAVNDALAKENITMS